MTRTLRLGVVRFLLICACALGSASVGNSYCALESSPCYRWDRYTALNGFFCRHWNIGAFDGNYLIGLAPGVSPTQYLSSVRAAKDRWESATTSALPDFSYTVNSPADSGTVSYWLWADDATWAARQFNPNAAGLTYRRVNGLGVVVHSRTWLHLRPTNWRWSPDCLTENCLGDGVTKPGLDLPSIATHEFGHWWVLLDVSAPGCEQVVMWGTTSTNSVRRTIEFADAIGTVMLYDQPVGTMTALVRAEAGAGGIALVWQTDRGDGAPFEVQRRSGESNWTRLSTVASDGVGRVEYLDEDTSPGSRYAYRLCDGAATHVECSAEVSLDYPAWRLSVTPLVSEHGGVLDARLTLPSRLPATLDLLDVAGRSLRRFEVGGYGPGVRELRIASRGELPAGVFWLRLRQGDRVVSGTVRWTR